jgi:hypothetical protein
VQIVVDVMSCVSGLVLDPESQHPAALERVLLLVGNQSRGGWNVAAEVTPNPADAAAGRFRLPVPLPREVCVVAVTRDFALAKSEPFRVPRGTTHCPLELRAGRIFPPFVGIGHAIAYDSGRRKLVLFGGSGIFNSDTNQHWEYDATMGWTQTHGYRVGGPSAQARPASSLLSRTAARRSSTEAASTVVSSSRASSSRLRPAKWCNASARA